MGLLIALIITLDLNRFFLGMGTEIAFSISTDERCSMEKADSLITLAYREIKRIENSYSRWVSSSVTEEINRNAGIKSVNVTEEFLTLLNKIGEIYEKTDGTFDITVCPIVKLWNVTERKTPPSHPEIKNLLPLVGYDKILINENSVFLPQKGMCIDLDGVLKGYAADRASGIILNGGCSSFLVKIGGSINVKNKRVDVKIPPPRKKLKEIKIEIENGAIATSGDYTRFFIYRGKRYHDLIDPENGYPSGGCASATVISESGMISDALSTALAIKGEKGFEFLQKFGAEGLCIEESGKIRKTKFFPYLQ
jgi:thiamine biosynthesis lipoprotein